MKKPADESIRPHVFDGIQEYDKKLPNWWLFTLYGAIAFSIAYWSWFQIYQMGGEPGRVLEEKMAEDAKLAARNATEITDQTLWDMSKDAGLVAAGKNTYLTTCAACHMADLGGQVGPNLKDHAWVHGAEPLTIAKIINEGVAAKGMPAWGPILGKQKINELTAFILSHHQPGEPVTIAPWVPGGGAPPTP